MAIPPLAVEVVTGEMQRLSDRPSTEHA